MNGPESISAIRAAREAIAPWIIETPVWRWDTPLLRERLGWARPGAVWLKLELLQRTGSFKARGALAVMRQLDADARSRGVTAISAGNHAIAVAYAASALGTSAKVVMPRSANPGRVAACRRHGAEVVLVDDIHAGFVAVEQIAADEGRTFVHPFEGPQIALATATLGLELSEQLDGALDAVLIPIGGGGLCAGAAAAIKLARPDCKIFGIEPVGADSMHLSFAAGSPQAIPSVRSIADSLGAPHAAPYSFDLCRAHVDELVHVDDDQLRAAMAALFQDAKLAVEPAAAASTAALLGPLRERLAGQRVALIVCGSNIDVASFTTLLAQRGPTTDALLTGDTPL
ncbi:pyridoxal-phosphate dependent enzyme [Pseudenhygromyxa sp. WMMC2535]|uniref:pyridoxal-phosphate dependent enzyme n=1 Tax=Pseudenhygromyxa sp. WMMC2535 TaxID=2712867 RepID=UPI0015547CD7|nr:pyridoxal-phosphate dependent enzyme [Pseudenhygromyxa sp. WMMC2535]